MGAKYQADNFIPPHVQLRERGNTGYFTAHVVAVAGTASTVHQFSTDWVSNGRYVTFDAEGANIRVIFSNTSGITAVAGTSGGGTRLYANTPQSWRLTTSSRYMAMLADSSTTYLSMYVSSPDQ